MEESVLKNQAPFKRYPKNSLPTENFFVIQHGLCGDDFFLCYNLKILWYAFSTFKNSEVIFVYTLKNKRPGGAF